MILHTLKLANDIILFKRGPQDMPKSVALFINLLIILFICLIVILLPLFTALKQGVVGEVFLTAVNLPVYFFILYIGLALCKRNSCFLQTAIAVAATHILLFILVLLLSIMMFIWINILALAAGGAIGDFSQQFVGVGLKQIYILLTPVYLFVLLPLFLFVILPHIYKLSFKVSYTVAMLISLIISFVTLSLLSNIIRMLLMLL